MKMKYKKIIIRIRKLLRVRHYSISSMDDDEKYIFFLILKILKKENTKILIRPISDIIHIQSEDESYYFIIGPNKIKFTNHQYLIDINIRESFFKKIKNIIYNKIEKDRENIENKIFSSKINVLQHIKNDM
jgi:hypothetical protein